MNFETMSQQKSKDIEKDAENVLHEDDKKDNPFGPEKFEGLSVIPPEELEKKAEKAEEERKKELAEQERLRKVIEEAGKPKAGEEKEERVAEELRKTIEGQ